jgi:hypothetical protein
MKINILWNIFVIDFGSDFTIARFVRKMEFLLVTRTNIIWEEVTKDSWSILAAICILCNPFPFSVLVRVQIKNKPFLPGFLSDYLQLPWHLWTNAAIHDDTCRGMHWLIGDILNTYYNILFHLWDTNVFGYILIGTFFLLVICESNAKSLSTPLS